MSEHNIIAFLQATHPQLATQLTHERFAWMKRILELEGAIKDSLEHPDAWQTILKAALEGGDG